MNNRNALIKLLNLESKRDILAKEDRRDEFVRTYMQRKTKYNGNNGNFWDDKFLETKQSINYIERDRNIVASKWLVKLIHLGNKKILNIGCGDGKFESNFLNQYPDISYEGTDFAAETIRKMRKIYPDRAFSVCDITQTKLKKNRYDTICVFEVLEHISDNNVFNVLKNIYSSLKPNGYFMVAVPLNEPLLEMFPQNPNEHVRVYSRNIILKELEISGFKILEVKEFIAFDSYYKIKSLISKLILKHKWKPNDILILAQKK